VAATIEREPQRRLERLIRATVTIGVVVILVGILPGRRVRSDDCLGAAIDNMAMTEVRHGGLGCTSHERTQLAGGLLDLPLAVVVWIALVPAVLLRRAPSRRRARGVALLAVPIVLLGAAAAFFLEFPLDLFEQTTNLWPTHVVAVGLAALVVLDVIVVVTAVLAARAGPVARSDRVG
jgi:hypothetical protein